MINFCHISPTKYLPLLLDQQRSHMALAHLVETDAKYVDFYKSVSDRGDYIILDNSAFEMYKQNRDMYDSDKLLDMATKIGASTIVLSDYPNKPSAKTVSAGERMSSDIKKEGFKTMFVPQSVIGDLTDYVNCFHYAINRDDLYDYVGFSILGVPNAFGVEKNNKLQRYLSRYALLKSMKNSIDVKKAHKRLHFLGLVDGPNEILLVEEFHDLIYSWDSSSAIWAGFQNVRFDSSPSGLVNGKIEKEVDFSITSLNNDQLEIVNYNMSIIDGYVNDYRIMRQEA